MEKKSRWKETAVLSEKQKDYKVTSLQKFYNAFDSIKFWETEQENEQATDTRSPPLAEQLILG